jgi:hypothetical protein
MLVGLQEKLADCIEARYICESTLSFVLIHDVVMTQKHNVEKTGCGQLTAVIVIEEVTEI